MSDHRKANRPPLRPFLPGEKVVNPGTRGSVSTERTVGIQDREGNHMTVPSLWMGHQGPVDLRRRRGGLIQRAVENYEKYSGKRFKRFKTWQEADKMAVDREAEWQSLDPGRGQEPKTSLFEDK